MDKNRINHKCFVYCNDKSGSHCTIWQYVFKSYMLNSGMETLVVNCSNTSAKYFSSEVVTNSLQSHIISWKDEINRDIGPSGRSRNKLRNYRLFKQDYMLENYVNARIPLKHRSALAKFRCGVAPLRLELADTKMFLKTYVNAQFVKNGIENETHVLFHCNAYNSLRTELYAKACNVNVAFNNLIVCDQDKLILVLSNDNMLQISANTCYLILNTRNHLLYR